MPLTSCGAGLTAGGPNGKVVGADNLFIADASVMLEVLRTNIPRIMIAELVRRCMMAKRAR
jgi:choline dehydrogenase-like flavoprotein